MKFCVRCEVIEFRDKLFVNSADGILYKFGLYFPIFRFLFLVFK
jgi:hypothetical protein